MKLGAVPLLFFFSCLAGCSSSDSLAGPAPTAPEAGPSEPTPEQDASIDPTPDAGPREIAVLSLNLHCLRTDGTAFTSNEARFASIAAAVKDEDVSAILAQEVCERPGTSTLALLTKAIEDATGAKWSSASAFAHPAWEGTADAADEHVAIFVRGTLASPRETAHRAQGSLRRVTLGGTANGLRLHTVHLDHANAPARAMQAREIASLSTIDAIDEGLVTTSDAGSTLPILIAGDFNAREGTEPLRAMTDFGFLDASASAGTTRIDHVLIHRTAPYAVRDRKVLFTGASAVSDHPGILVRLEPAAAKPAPLTWIAARGTFATPLTVRGDHAPLTWELGWPTFPWKTAKEPSVAIATTEMDASPFLFKFLKSDTDWQIGANAAGTGHTENALTPTFP